jgi:hypothetical protein
MPGKDRHSVLGVGGFASAQEINQRWDQFRGGRAAFIPCISRIISAIKMSLPGSELRGIGGELELLQRCSKKMEVRNTRWDSIIFPKTRGQNDPASLHLMVFPDGAVGRACNRRKRGRQRGSSAGAAFIGATR